MMLKKSKIKLIITIIPLVMLLALSGYLAIIAFGEYDDNKKFKNILTNVQLLQDYERAILNETLCMVLVPKESKKNPDICKDRSTQSSYLLKRIKHDNNLEHWEQKISQIKENSSQNNINHFEKILGRDDVVSAVQSYLNKVVYHTKDIEEKKLLRSYINISDVGYATELENFLVTYYLTKKIPISTFNIIFWDKIVESSYLMNFEDEINIPLVRENLVSLTTDSKYLDILSKIDDMRIIILTGKMDTHNKNLDWIVLLEKKQDAINAMKSIVYSALDIKAQKHIDQTFWLFIAYIIMFIIALLSAVYSYFKIKTEKSEKKALLNVVHKINALSAYGSVESDVMNKMLVAVKSKEDILAYIYSSFQLLHEKSKQAQDDGESKSQFLATLSHEIRTPLNGIIGFSKLLKDMGTTADQKEYLSLIEGSSQKLIMIVNDILDLSKMDADKMEIENVSFDLCEMIESTMAAFVHETDQKDIEFGIFVDPFISHYLLGDGTKLSQILTNLIGNAIKFTKPYGKINVFVQSLRNKKDEVQIKFSVNDNGIGLTEEQIKNIFNPFSQATKSTSKKYGGTGLGLTISRQMVELMGGQLEVKSKLKEGAAFYFTLTLKKDMEKKYKPSLSFKDVSVGLALPVKNIKRQLDTNLEVYIRHLGAAFSIYYYEDLFESYKIIELPDIMIFDHHYARLPGELEQCASLDCKTILLTNGGLRSRINPEKHTFEDVLLTPISITKCIRILSTKETEKPLVKLASKKETEVNETLENIESFKGLHALVADDNIINRKLIKIILEQLGIDVTLVINGKEACESYQSTSYDIIFMDIQMPIMDGVDATHCILKYESKNKLSHVPIVALTANVATGDKERYIAEGMDAYTTKPLVIDTIKSIISTHCTTSETSKNKVK